MEDRDILPSSPAEPVVLDRSRHPISRRSIDPDALKVLYRLHGHGFMAYLVGGAVRDLLLGRCPQDFDIGTDARPGQIKKLFGNSFLIGRRFRLAHIKFQGGKIVEVATFRREPEAPDKDVAEGENTYGTPREDAFRRDITINALFYDIATYSVIDYVGGLEDLACSLVRVIGDPAVRYVEDPVRIWRVLRHAARLDFRIEQRTEAAIASHRDLLAGCPGSRLFEELNKDLKSGEARPLLERMRKHGTLPFILGDIGRALQSDPEAVEKSEFLLSALDRAVSSHFPLSWEEAYSLLFWPWAEPLLMGMAGDRVKLLGDAFAAARAAATVPRSLRYDIVQTMVIINAMLEALDSGRMKWSLRKRPQYPSASKICGLMAEGHFFQDQDPFGKLYRAKFGSGPPRRRHKKLSRRPEETV